MNNDIALLHQKIDALTEQITFLTIQADQQNRRQMALDELKADLIPMANHMIKLGILELAEIGDEFQIEDIFFLLKRIMRNTPLILDLFDRLESLMGIADESALLGKQVFNHAVEQLDNFEQEGYFEFAHEGWKILERIIKEYSKEDVQALGDNVVTILNTIRSMTQPEILALANNAIGVMQEDIPDTKTFSLWDLLTEMRNPQIRRGMVRMLNFLKTLDN